MTIKVVNKLPSFTPAIACCDAEVIDGEYTHSRLSLLDRSLGVSGFSRFLLLSSSLRRSHKPQEHI